jgi:hypothetical protein
MDLTAKTIDASGDLLGGMGQASEIRGVEFHAPEWPDLEVKLRGVDGKAYTLSARDMWDMSGSSIPWGDQWSVFCPRLAVGSQLRLIVAAINMKDRTAPHELRVFGNYDIASSTGAQTAKFDETLRISQ